MIRSYLEKVLQSYFFLGLILTATTYALFGLDLATWLQIPKEYDYIFHTLTTLTLILFIFEMVVSSLVLGSYFMSLFFWMDLIATISLIPDIPFLVAGITAITGISMTNLSSLTLARAARAARVGARAGRVVQGIKVLSAYLKISEFGTLNQSEKEMSPTSIGLLFTEGITRKCVVGVMLLLFTITLLNSNDGQLLDQRKLELTQFEKFSGADLAVGALQYRQTNPNLLYMRVGRETFVSKDLSKFRDNEILSVNVGSIDAKFSLLSQLSTDALNSIIVTLIVIIVLCVGTWRFSVDANKYFIRPIEKMIDTVDKLTVNPLMNLSLEEEGSKEDETIMIQKALSRFGNLLQIGFGEAGSSMISKCLTVDGKFDPMVAGQKVNAIFGFCDIRQFTNTTECLQEEVMLFVNHIATIVHAAVHESGGFPNQNIGDAFLLVWKRNSDRGSMITGNTVLQASIEIMDRIDNSPELFEFVERFQLEERIPNYKVRMGLGLDVGWAIEGVIGTPSKISATYLSPHVNLASRLETATKKYGVPLLMSGDFYSLLTGEYRARSRKIDHVVVKGMSKPIDLYTYDLLIPKDYPLEQYYEYFCPAISTYIEGDWSLAATRLSYCLEIFRDDYPAQVLFKFIEEHQFNAPSSWKGYRHLKEGL